MSILLDALRKSEEQRRLGSTPSIHAGSEPQGAGNDTAQQWVPLSLIALSAIAMAWIGWQQYQRPVAGSPPGAATPVEQTAVEGEAAAVADRSVANGPAEQLRPASPDRPNGSRRTPVEQFAQGSRTEQAHAGTAAERADDTRKAQVTDSFQAYEGGSEAAGGDEQPGDPEPGLTAPDIVLEPPPTVRPSPEPGATQPREARPEPAATEPITYWELPQGVRDSLPELRISVLVYADQPEDRFLLISGQRLVEKDEFQDGIVLDEIRRDGAVFLYRAYRFLVKG